MRVLVDGVARGEPAQLAAHFVALAGASVTRTASALEFFAPRTQTAPLKCHLADCKSDVAAADPGRLRNFCSVLQPLGTPDAPVAEIAKRIWKNCAGIVQ